MYTRICALEQKCRPFNTENKVYLFNVNNDENLRNVCCLARWMSLSVIKDLLYGDKRCMMYDVSYVKIKTIVETLSQL